MFHNISHLIIILTCRQLFLRVLLDLRLKDITIFRLFPGILFNRLNLKIEPVRQVKRSENWTSGTS